MRKENRLHYELTLGAREKRLNRAQPRMIKKANMAFIAIG